MVRPEHDHGVLGVFALVQSIDDAADLRIGKTDTRVVGLNSSSPAAACLEPFVTWRQRIVRQFDRRFGKIFSVVVFRCRQLHFLDRESVDGPRDLWRGPSLLTPVRSAEPGRASRVVRQGGGRRRSDPVLEALRQ